MHEKVRRREKVLERGEGDVGIERIGHILELWHPDLFNNMLAVEDSRKEKKRQRK